MKYCDKCKINYTGTRHSCPLCSNSITDRGGKSEDIFPYIPTIYHQYNIFFKILIFASIVIDVITVFLNIIIPQTGIWSLFVVAGTACFWILLGVTIRKRSNIPKTILYQCVTISVLSYGWDLITGWHKWSINYVIPAVCIAAMLTFTIIAITFKMYSEDIVFYISLNAFFGIVPVIFVIFNWVTIRYIALACVSVSIISLAAMLIFEGKTVKSELSKRFHL